MILNQYLINTKNDIIQLKKDLMTEYTKDTGENNNTYIDKKSIISDVKSMIKSDLGLIFEENIRGTLKYEYLLDESDFPRSVIYKRIKIGQDSFTIFSPVKKLIKINGKYYSFQINKDYSISITNKKNTFINNVKDNQAFFSVNSETISFFPHKELEVDGIFLIKNKFSTQMFNNDEVKVIFNNVKKNEEDKFDFAVLEIKLDPSNLKDIISQIKRDENFFQSITKEKILYIGFVGAGNIEKINFKDVLHTKCVIYSIKNNKLSKRNLVRSIDWITIDKVNKLNKKMNTITKEVNELTKEIKEMNNKIDMIIRYLGINKIEIEADTSVIIRHI